MAAGKVRAPRPSRPPKPDPAVVAAFLGASRALVGIAARSIALVEQTVTLQQYRALLVLAERGEQRVTALAEALLLHPSSVTRLCDRLVAKELIDRSASAASRREVEISLTARGRAVVRSVMRARQAEIVAVLGQMPASARAEAVGALDAFARAAGDLPDDAWRLGWSG